MASRRKFFCRVSTFLKGRSSGVYSKSQVLIALSTAFVSLGISPVSAEFTAAPTVVPPLPSTLEAKPNLMQQGKILYDEGQFAEAVKILRQADQEFSTQGDILNRAVALSHLSLVYQQLGDWSQASATITSSLKLLQSQGNSKERSQILAQVLNTQGQLQLVLGQAQQALTTWQQSTNAYTQAGDTAGMALSQINQAQAQQALGLYRRALESLEQVNQSLQKQPDSLLKTAGLLQLGSALRGVGELNQSRQVLQQSLNMAQQLRSPQNICAALLNLGNTAHAQQDTKAALAFYQQAADASSSPLAKTQAQLNQLKLLLETEHWSAAQALWPALQTQIAILPPSHSAIYAQINFADSLSRLKQHTTVETPSWLQIAQITAAALQEAKTNGDQRAESYALGTLGELYEKSERWSDAQRLTQQALILAQAINAPDIAYRWQWQLGRLLKFQGNMQGAIAAYTQSVNALKSLRSDLVGINPEIQFSFRDEVEPVYRQLVDLLLQTQGNSQPSQQNLVQARAVIESLQLAELNNFFRVACLEAKPVLVDQVVDKQDPTAAVLYPIILPNRLEVILKLPKQQNLYHYTVNVSQIQVESTLEQLRQNLEKPYTAPEGRLLSQQVYNWLLRPVEAKLAKSRVQTLVFVLDGALRNIPMAALHDGKQYLIQRYGIDLTPGLSLLNPKLLKQVQLRALAAGLTEAHNGFSALTNVALELKQLKNEISSVVLLNQEFTSTELQKQINSLEFPVVHLATHGQFSSNPEQTFILAWDKRINVNELSQLLQLRDQSKQNALELLVLSACQTATGDNRAALGLAGVAVRSGARSTLASLWNSDDESASQLLSKFYAELAKPSVTKAEALRRAQLALLKEDVYRSPAYWANYVLVGNWL